MSGTRYEAMRRAIYFAGAMALIASQNLVAWWAMRAFGQAPLADATFWLTPLRSALEIDYLPAVWGGAIFAYSLLVAWLLALASFRQAQRNNRVFVPAILSVVPLVQLFAITAIALLPARTSSDAEDEETRHVSRSVAFGLLAGVALIVLAVLVSAVSFGAYGWGLFVMTPFLVGATTGYLVNAQGDLGAGRTMMLALGAAGLGSLALVVLALEGIVCILLAAPLAVPVVLLGAALGRALAMAQNNRRNPLASVAVLPMVFMLEAAVPPEAPIATRFAIEIDAPADRVWQALTASEPIGIAPGLPALAGLAYPVSARLEGHGAGARRIGAFSTGSASEVVTQWQRNRVLAFRVEHQPPAMEEMSPYRRVHTPHLQGYFLTGETRFGLTPTPGGTRLDIRSEHRLRIDPVPYWEPIARLAIRHNVTRVLRDIKNKAERAK